MSLVIHITIAPATQANLSTHSPQNHFHLEEQLTAMIPFYLEGVPNIKLTLAFPLPCNSARKKLCDVASPWDPIALEKIITFLSRVSKTLTRLILSFLSLEEVNPPTMYYADVSLAISSKPSTPALETKYCDGKPNCLCGVQHPSILDPTL